MSKNTTVRAILCARHSICHWCGCALIDLPQNEIKGHRRGDMATVDHVKCKAECISREEYNHAANKVLACYDCNNRRNADFIRKVGGSPKPRLIRESARIPQGSETRLGRLVFRR